MKSFTGFVTEQHKIDPAWDRILNELNESVSIANIGTVGNLISSYFSRKLKTNLVRMPGGEEFFNSKESGFGIRFFMTKPVNGMDSIRFNWVKKRIDSASVDSVDLFSKGKNVYNIAFDTNTSLVKVLPFLFHFIKDPKRGTVSYITGETISESNSNPFHDINEMLIKLDPPMNTIAKDQLRDLISKNLRRVDPGIAAKLYTALRKNYPNYLIRNKDTKKIEMDILGGKLGKISDSLFASTFTRAKVSSGSSNETYEVSPKAEEMERQGLERLTFEEQLGDLKEAIFMLYRGITNAVFIGGRGGIGKTFNVEGALKELGLADGEGYFKNAGSISASGLYRLLFRHRKDLILFDDSDSVFSDQEARNILKGATDTKKVRKIAWTKKSSDIIPAEEYNEESEEDGKVPSYFEFTGKIVFISNLKMDKLDPDGALRTRGIIVMVDPTDEEVYNLMEKIVGNFDIAEGLTLGMKERLEVVQLLRDNPSKDPNFRTLDRALNMRAGATAGFDWKKFVLYYA